MASAKSLAKGMQTYWILMTVTGWYGEGSWVICQSFDGSHPQRRHHTVSGTSACSNCSPRAFIVCNVKNRQHVCRPSRIRSLLMCVAIPVMRCWSESMAVLQWSCLACHLNEHCCTLCRLGFSALWGYPCTRQWWAHLRMLGPCWMVWWPTTSVGKLLQLAARTHAPDVLHLVRCNQQWSPVTASACHD